MRHSQVASFMILYNGTFWISPRQFWARIPQCAFQPIQLGRDPRTLLFPMQISLNQSSETCSSYCQLFVYFSLDTIPLYVCRLAFPSWTGMYYSPPFPQLKKKCPNNFLRKQVRTECSPKNTKMLSISFNSGTLIKLDNLIMSKTTYIMATDPCPDSIPKS